MNSFYGFGGGLQLVFVNIYSLVLGYIGKCYMLKAEAEIMDKEQTIIIINNIASLYLFPCFDHTGSISQDVYVFVFMVLVDF